MRGFGRLKQALKQATRVRIVVTALSLAHLASPTFADRLEASSPEVRNLNQALESWGYAGDVAWCTSFVLGGFNCIREDPAYFSWTIAVRTNPSRVCIFADPAFSIYVGGFLWDRAVELSEGQCNR